MSSNSMFAGAMEWFLGRGGDRRRHNRRAGAFRLWWLPAATGSQPRPGVGLEISPTGLMFMIPEPIDGAEFNLVLRIREIKIPVRVKSVRTDRVQHQGKEWNRYMGEFTGIAADHWDAIVRYVNDQADPASRPEQPVARADDAYRLLPMAIQQKLIAKLIEQRKLEAPPAGQSPLMKIFYGGVVQRPGQKPLHSVSVHSRIAVKDELMAYDTRFLISEEGEVTLG